MKFNVGDKVRLESSFFEWTIEQSAQVEIGGVRYNIYRVRGSVLVLP